MKPSAGRCLATTSPAQPVMFRSMETNLGEALDGRLKALIAMAERDEKCSNIYPMVGSWAVGGRPVLDGPAELSGLNSDNKSIGCIRAVDGHNGARQRAMASRQREEAREGGPGLYREHPRTTQRFVESQGIRRELQSRGYLGNTQR